MIIDCHGHYTTTPPGHQAYRDAQLAALASGSPPPPPSARITDEEIRESVEGNQLRMADERGVDITIFSPKASGMEHHVPDLATARDWARACNDLVHRVVSMFPDRFAGACQLPQTPGAPVETAVDELVRCVEELGFVGCNFNPDPSGGHWTSPPLTDEHWFPLYEAMVELEVPAMVHVSASCNDSFHATGAHYLNADTSVFMQLLQVDLFDRFPTLRFVIPHGGGAVPYHWGRYRGIAERMGRSGPEALMGNVVFDTCVYHQPGIDLLLDVVDHDHILFGSEVFGAVRGADPETGIAWDDTLRYLSDAGLAEQDAAGILAGNARRTYPRLDRRLSAQER